MTGGRSNRAAGALLLLCAACGGGQTQGIAFDPQWQSDDGAAIGAFQRRFAATRVPFGVDVAVGVTGDTLIGVPLEGGAPWTFAHALEGRPAVAGSVVVGVGAGEAFALDALTGKPLWQRAVGGKLRGAGDDGKTTVLSFVAPSGEGSYVLAVAHDGSILRRIEDPTAIGVPAVVDGYAFLPWQTQYVTAYDLNAGSETARVLLRSQTSRAFLAGGALFFGELGATRFDDKIRLGAQNKASTVSLPTNDLPGSPRWMRPGILPPPRTATAEDKVRLYARPLATGDPGIEGDRYAATYFRVAIGLGAHDNHLAWARLADGDYLGGAAYGAGFALCDASGKVTLVEAKSGGVVAELTMGKPIDACIVQADAMAKSRAKAPAPPRPIAEQAAETVACPDAELATIQRYMLKELRAMKDESVTKTLVELAANPRTSPFLLEDVRAALAARRNGASFLLAALDEHVDFLTGVTRPPPIGPIADALGAMGEKRAAPLLAAHLNDPADTPDDVARAAAALVPIATPAELGPISEFFASYRCVTGAEGQGSLDKAVVSAGQALVKIGGAERVKAAARDPFTSEAVRPRLTALVKP